MTDRKDIPAAAKDIKFPAVEKGSPRLAQGFPADIRNQLGPFKYTSPGGTRGTFAESLRVVFEGCGLKNTKVTRYIRMSGESAGKPTTLGGGYTFFGRANDKSALDDFSADDLVTEDKVLALYDAPGFSFSKAGFPASYKANFYVVVTDKATNKTIGQAWFDVTVTAKAADDKNPVIKISSVRTKP